MADKVIEVATPTVSAIAHTSDAKQLREEVTRLSRLVAALTQDRPRGSRSHSRSRGRRSPHPTGLSRWSLLVPQQVWTGSKEVPAALQLGKRPGRTLTATSVPGHSQTINSCCLFYVFDVHSHTRFLVDTGSEVSVVPLSLSDRRRSPDPLTLMAVNNTHIRTYDKRSLALNLQLRR